MNHVCLFRAGRSVRAQRYVAGLTRAPSYFTELVSGQIGLTDVYAIVRHAAHLVGYQRVVWKPRSPPLGSDGTSESVCTGIVGAIRCNRAE